MRFMILVKAAEGDRLVIALDPPVEVVVPPIGGIVVG